MAKRTNTATQTSMPVSEQADAKNTMTVNETVIPAPKKKAPVKKARQYEEDDLIMCRSLVAGELRIIGVKTKNTYRFMNIGDVQYMEYQDLLSAMLSRKRYIFAPKIVIEDQELLQDFHWKRVAEVYEGLFDPDEFENILRLPVPKFRAALEKMPNSVRKNLATLAASMFENGEFDSVNKIRILDELCGTDLQTMLL